MLPLGHGTTYPQFLLLRCGRPPRSLCAGLSFLAHPYAGCRRSDTVPEEPISALAMHRGLLIIYNSSTSARRRHITGVVQYNFIGKSCEGRRGARGYIIHRDSNQAKKFRFFYSIYPKNLWKPLQTFGPIEQRGAITTQNTKVSKFSHHFNHLANVFSYLNLQKSRSSAPVAPLRTLSTSNPPDQLRASTGWVEH